MNHPEEIIQLYFQGLEKTSHSDIIKLFSKEAIVHSPIYGQIKPVKFYEKLFSATNHLKITPKNIFINPTNPQVVAAHFLYDWMLKDGTKDSSECVDIFEFESNSNQIIKLTIIFDTFHIRQAFDSITNSNR